MCLHVAVKVGYGYARFKVNIEHFLQASHALQPPCRKTRLHAQPLNESMLVVRFNHTAFFLIAYDEWPATALNSS